MNDDEQVKPTFEDVDLTRISAIRAATWASMFYADMANRLTYGAEENCAEVDEERVQQVYCELNDLHNEAVDVRQNRGVTNLELAIGLAAYLYRFMMGGSCICDDCAKEQQHRDNERWRESDDNVTGYA